MISKKIEDAFNDRSTLNCILPYIYSLHFLHN